MAEFPLAWFSPDPRMVLYPCDLHVSRSLRPVLRRSKFTLTADTAFAEVIARCADPDRRADQDSTWITDDMLEAYQRLHGLGFAHSIEAWDGGVLAGGIYGVSLGGAFFGESMFFDVPNASKVAFVGLVRQCQRWGFGLIDCQVHTDHVTRYGAVEIPRERFLTELAELMEAPTRRGPWRLDDELVLVE